MFATSKRYQVKQGSKLNESYQGSVNGSDMPCQSYTGVQENSENLQDILSLMKDLCKKDINTSDSLVIHILQTIFNVGWWS